MHAQTGSMFALLLMICAPVQRCLLGPTCKKSSSTSTELLPDAGENDSFGAANKSIAAASMGRGKGSLFTITMLKFVLK